MIEDRDQETRRRLLEAAARLFARRGFKDVTVREICRSAKANVAAVNYHFKGKLGLYTAVIKMVIDEIRGTSDVARQAGEGASAEEKLRIYVRVFLERITAKGRDSWIHQLMSREMTNPSPAFDLIVKQGIRPRIEYLAGLVSELLGCPPNDPRVMRAVAGIQSQFLFCLVPGVSRVTPAFTLTPEKIDITAEHIAAFSLGGITALRAHTKAS
jgi:AcrR family transcriptional regulator